MRRRIRIFTDFGLVGSHNTIHMLEPLSETVRRDPMRESWRQSVTKGYEIIGPDLYEIVADPRDADVAVLPFAWEDTEDRVKAGQAAEFCGRAHEVGKATLIFSHHDPEPRIKLPNTIVFRPSARRSRRPRNVVVMPTWTQDTLELATPGTPATLPTRTWQDVPSVGFCGNAYPLGRRHLTLRARTVADVKLFLRQALTVAGLADRLGVRATVHERVAAIRRLQRADGIETDFLIRSADYYWAGDYFQRPGTQVDDGFDPRAYRREFVENLLRTDYVLCVRGNANYSMRIYEGMAAGCIPLFVDTDCVLPCEREVAWRDLVVFVPSKQRARVAEVLTREHSRMTPEEFAKRGARCREVWQERLSAAGFFRTIAGRLQDVVARADGAPLAHAQALEALADPR